MKRINEMSDAEILALTDEQVEKMKKLVLAENGIKFLEAPKDVELFDIEEPNITVYNIPFLGSEISFADRGEAENMLDVLRKCKSIGMVKKDYKANCSFFKQGKEKEYYYYQNEPFSVNTSVVYTYDKYSEIKQFSEQNEKMREQLEKDRKEYNESMSKYIELTHDITEKVSSVREKYQRLDLLKRKLNEEYTPLADGNKELGMKFLSKAYSLTKDEQEYILSDKE